MIVQATTPPTGSKETLHQSHVRRPSNEKVMLAGQQAMRKTNHSRQHISNSVNAQTLAMKQIDGKSNVSHAGAENHLGRAKLTEKKRQFAEQQQLHQQRKVTSYNRTGGSRQENSGSRGPTTKLSQEMDISPSKTSVVSGGKSDKSGTASYMQALRRGKRPMPTLTDVSLRQVLHSAGGAGEKNILNRRFNRGKASVCSVNEPHMLPNSIIEAAAINNTGRAGHLRQNTNVMRNNAFISKPGTTPERRTKLNVQSMVLQETTTQRTLRQKLFTNGACTNQGSILELSEAQENQSVMITGGNESSSGNQTMMDMLAAQKAEDASKINQGLSGLSQAALMHAQNGNAVKKPSGVRIVKNDLMQQTTEWADQDIAVVKIDRNGKVTNTKQRFLSRNSEKPDETEIVDSGRHHGQITNHRNLIGLSFNEQRRTKQAVMTPNADYPLLGTKPLSQQRNATAMRGLKRAVMNATESRQRAGSRQKTQTAASMALAGNAERKRVPMARAKDYVIGRNNHKRPTSIVKTTEKMSYSPRGIFPDKNVKVDVQLTLRSDRLLAVSSPATVSPYLQVTSSAARAVAKRKASLAMRRESVNQTVGKTTSDSQRTSEVINKVLKTYYLDGSGRIDPKLQQNDDTVILRSPLGDSDHPEFSSVGGFQSQKTASNVLQNALNPSQAAESQLAALQVGSETSTNHDQTVVERLQSHEDEPNMPSQIHEGDSISPAAQMEANERIVSGTASKNATQNCDFKQDSRIDVGEMSVASGGSPNFRRPVPSVSNQFKKPSFVKRTQSISSPRQETASAQPRAESHDCDVAHERNIIYTATNQSVVVGQDTPQNSSLLHFKPVQTAQIREVVLSSSRLDSHMTTIDRAHEDTVGDLGSLRDMSPAAYQSALVRVNPRNVLLPRTHSSRNHDVVLQQESVGSVATSGVSKTRKTRAERQQANMNASSYYYRTIGSKDGNNDMFNTGGMAMVKEEEGFQEQQSIEMPESQVDQKLNSMIAQDSAVNGSQRARNYTTNVSREGSKLSQRIDKQISQSSQNRLRGLQSAGPVRAENKKLFLTKPKQREVRNPAPQVATSAFNVNINQTSRPMSSFDKSIVGLNQVLNTARSSPENTNKLRPPRQAYNQNLTYKQIKDRNSNSNYNKIATQSKGLTTTNNNGNTQPAIDLTTKSSNARESKQQQMIPTKPPRVMSTTSSEALIATSGPMMQGIAVRGTNKRLAKRPSKPVLERKTPTELETENRAPQLESLFGHSRNKDASPALRRVNSSNVATIHPVQQQRVESTKNNQKSSAVLDTLAKKLQIPNQGNHQLVINVKPPQAPNKKKKNFLEFIRHHKEKQQSKLESVQAKIVAAKNESEREALQMQYASMQKQLFQVSDFQISLKIGQGAFASVQRATHKKTGHAVALKVYDKKNLRDKESSNALHREIFILAMIDHENICQLHEVVDSRSHVHLVMELCEGKSLYHTVKKAQEQAVGGMKESQCRTIFAQILAAVDHMHSRSVVHRDLKLDNILVDGSNRVKIIDFGFATKCDANEKLTFFCGTPHYMDPDLVRKNHYSGQAADVWALGVILFTLLTGRMPYFAEFEADLFRKIQSAKFQWPRNYRQGSENVEDTLSPQVKNLVKRIFEPNADMRPTAAQLLEDPWIRGTIIKT